MPQTDPLAATLLPVLVEQRALIDAMDDRLNHQYMFGEQNTSSWVAPWQPSELAVVDRAYALAGVSRSDVVCDLGCGDGRVLLRLSALCGCRGLGWDVSEDAVHCARALASAAKADGLISFEVVDFTLPLSVERRDTLRGSSVVFLYLLHYGLERIRPLLEDLIAHNPKLKLVTNFYHLPVDFLPIIARDESDVVRVLQRG